MHRNDVLIIGGPEVAAALNGREKRVLDAVQNTIFVALHGQRQSWLVDHPAASSVRSTG